MPGCVDTAAAAAASLQLAQFSLAASQFHTYSSQLWHVVGKQATTTIIKEVEEDSEEQRQPHASLARIKLGAGL